MKTSNVNQGRAHPEAIIRGWVSNKRAGSTGITVTDGTTSVGGTIELTIEGGTIVFTGDGKAILIIDDTAVNVNTPITAALSNPPTQAELETAIGSSASEVAGQAYIVTDADTGLGYVVWSTGESFAFIPTTETVGDLETIATSRGIFSDFTAGVGAAAYDATSGKVFWTYLNASGDACVSSWDGATLVNTTLRSALDPGDLHAQPALLIRSSDRKVIVAYSAHIDSHLYIRISSAAADISAFGAESNIAATVGGTDYTYPVLIELSDAIYLFIRTYTGTTPGGQFNHAGAIWSYTKSTDNGATWSAKTQVMSDATYGMYWMPSKTADDRVDFMVADRSTFDATGGSEFHMYMIGGTFYTTDGTAITATKPFNQTALTEVWASDGTQASAPGFVAAGADGNLRAVFREFEDISPEDGRYYWAIYDGTWTAQEIAASGSGSPRATAVLEPGDPSTVWYTKDDGSIAQVHRISTPDDGATWLDRQITDAADDQSRLAAIHNRTTGLAVMWMDGYVNDTTNSDFTGASFVSVDGADAQRVVVIDGTGRAEAIFQRTSGGVWQISRDLGSSWEDLGGGSPLTTKGDLHGFSTVDARIPAGADGTVLTADSTAATGLSWQTPSNSGQHILLADGHATPFTFNDLLQMDDGSDFMWSDA